MKQEQVVQKILENNGNMGKAMKEVGYSDNYSNNPQDLKETKGFQKVVRPIVERMERERERIMAAMELKDVNAEDYKVLKDAIETFTKNIQLLTGKATERIEGIQALTDILRTKADAHTTGNSQDIQDGTRPANDAD